MTTEKKPTLSVRLADQVAYAEGAVVSKTLVDKKAGTITLFAFDAGQGLSEHTAPYDAAVQVLDGQASLTVGGEEIVASAGDFVVMAAGVPHSVRAVERLKMMLVMIRS